MNTASAATRVGLLLASAGLVGWYYSQPLLAVALALLSLLAYWLYQMHQVQQWLNNSEQPPPEIYGIWGDILSRIYQLQRRDREARARLQSTVDYLRDSFAAMRDGVVIVDEHGGLKWFNEPARLLLSLRSADEGQNLMNLVRSPEFLRYFNRGDYSQPLQYRDGGTYLRIDITRFGDGDRLLFVRDVTAGVKMEVVRKDFVANVSHELRTPLTVITGYLDTLLGTGVELDQRLFKPLKQMAQQAGRMEGLIKDLLLLSRLEGERSHDEHGPVDMRALLEEVVEEMGTSYPERRLILEIAATSTALGNYRELHSALSNLVLNAIKYSPDDSTVALGWRVENGNGYLWVRDEGVGVEASHIPRLTERFYRVEDSRNTATGGTGLGLAIVKHVAVVHGARLQIQSELGKGSTFSLVFPATQRGETDQT